MDAEDALAELEELVASARPVPLSMSVMVHRSTLEELVGRLREDLPEEVREARWILKERDDLLEQARIDAQRITADAQAERERLIEESEVAKAAQRRAEEIVEDAREQARVLRLEAEDYVDAKLANFEIALQRTLRTVERGRERLRGRDDQAPPQAADAEDGSSPERTDDARAGDDSAQAEPVVFDQERQHRSG